MKESKNLFVVYDSDTHATSQQGKGHQPWYELVDPKQGNNNPEFEKPRWNNVREKAYNIVFSNQETHQLSPLNMFESKQQRYVYGMHIHSYA